jgi:hypothetical protein
MDSDLALSGFFLAERILKGVANCLEKHGVCRIIIYSTATGPKWGIAQMSQDKSRIVVVQFDEIMHQTLDAVLFYFKDDMDDELSENELWLPRSLIEYNETTRQVFLPEYLAEEKGLII